MRTNGQTVLKCTLYNENQQKNAPLLNLLITLPGRNTSAKGTKSGDPDVSAYLFRQPEEQVFQTIFQHYVREGHLRFKYLHFDFSIFSVICPKWPIEG